jgi:hypothetical protein
MRTDIPFIVLISLVFSGPVVAQEVAAPQEPTQPPEAPVAAQAESPARTDQPVATGAANEAAAPAEKKFAAPAGYKEKTRGGTTVYCRSQTPVGTRFATEYCYTQADLQRMEKSKQGMQDDVSRATRVCGSGQSCSGG